MDTMLPIGSWSLRMMAGCIASAIVTDSAIAQPCSPIIDMGNMGGFWARANDVADDGSTIVGSAENDVYLWTAYRWTLSEGMVPIYGLPGDALSWAYAVSNDGSVVAGSSSPFNMTQIRAFLWKKSGGKTALGVLPGGKNSSAFGLSGNGTFVVGMADGPTGVVHAMRWSAGTGMQDIDTLNSEESCALDVSADGSVVVGWFALKPNSLKHHAFRWTQATGMLELEGIGGTIAEAHAITDDGSMIVGLAQSPAQPGYSYPVRWSHAGKVEILSDQPGALYGLSSDGRYATGVSALGLSRWSEIAGMQNLGTFPNYNIFGQGVSDDGTVICANGDTASFNDPHAFRWIQSPADCDASGSLSLNDFVCFQTAFASGDPLVDCDGNDELSIDDFVCFQTVYAVGC